MLILWDTNNIICVMDVNIMNIICRMLVFIFLIFLFALILLITKFKEE